MYHTPPQMWCMYLKYKYTTVVLLEAVCFARLARLYVRTHAYTTTDPHIHRAAAAVDRHNNGIRYNFDDILSRLLARMICLSTD